MARGYRDPTDTWPESARDIAYAFGFGEMRLPCETNDEGQFVVAGFASGTSATIEIPEGYEFAEAKYRGIVREFPVICNGEPVFIELVAMKQLTGRVEGQPFDLPPSNQWANFVEFEIRYDLIRNSYPPITGSLRTRPGERVVVFFSDATLEGVDLEIWSQWGRRLASHQVHERIDGSKDIGVIMIEKPPNVAFLVKDHGGRPIPDARVLSDGLVSEATNYEGHTLLGIAQGTRFIIAGAPAFQTD